MYALQQISRTFLFDLARSKSPAEALNSSTPSSSSICTTSLRRRENREEDRKLQQATSELILSNLGLF